MIIYTITNRVNGKQYVGQTIYSLERRWRLHCSKYSGCTAIHNAIEKYGVSNFEINIIDHATTQQELDEKEQYWITTLKTLAPSGYNLKCGGEHPTGCKFSDEIKRRQSQNLKQQWADGKRKGHPLTAECKEKLKQGIQNAAKNGAYDHLKKPVLCVETGVVYPSIQSASEAIGCYPQNLTRHLRGVRPTCKGYHWRYVV